METDKTAETQSMYHLAHTIILEQLRRQAHAFEHMKTSRKIQQQGYDELNSNYRGVLSAYEILQTNYHRLQSDHGSLQEAYEHLQICDSPEMDKLKKDRDELRDRVDIQADNILEYQTRREELEREYTAAKFDAAQYKAGNEALLILSSKLRSDYDNLIEERNELLKRIEEYQARQLQYTNRIADLEHEVAVRTRNSLLDANQLIDTRAKLVAAQTVISEQAAEIQKLTQLSTNNALLREQIINLTSRQS